MVKNRRLYIIVLLGLIFIFGAIKYPVVIKYLNSEPEFKREFNKQVVYTDSLLKKIPNNFYYIDNPKEHNWNIFIHRLNNKEVLFIYYSGEDCHLCYYITPLIINMAKANKNVAIYMFEYKFFNNENGCLFDSLNKYGLFVSSTPMMKIYKKNYKKNLIPTRLGLMIFWLKLKWKSVVNYFIHLLHPYKYNEVSFQGRS